MFTGIVSTTGTIRRLEPRDGDCRLEIQPREMNLAGLRTGDSIAVAGVCLTIVDKDQQQFTADVSGETLSLTTLGFLQPGDHVNLEAALMAGEPLGGHLVSGHVDGVAKVLDIVPDGRSRRLRFEVPGSLKRYVARKGSICIDGVSLTVNGVAGCEFDVNLIPLTWEQTTLGGLAVGDSVNIEVDMLARYMERLLEQSQQSPGRGEEGVC